MKLPFLCKDKAHVIISLAMLTALVYITVLTSCHKEDLQDGSIPDTIDEYRTFYEEQIYNSETKGHSMIPRRSPQWGKAKIQKWNRGYAAVTPLDYEEKYFIWSSSSPYNMDLRATSFLMVNKGRGGSMQGEIVYFIPDGQVRRSDKGGQSRFSGTIVAENLHGELLAAYVSQPDGSVWRYGKSGATASPKKVDSKGLDCWIYELWQKTSIDGGRTWSYRLLSSHEECYYTSDSDCEESVGYYDLGGTGDDPAGGINIYAQSSRTLSADESQLLYSVRIALSNDCATNKVINTVWGSLSFNVDGFISEPAQYAPNINTITFRNSSDINANAILEEVFHAYQATIYPGGTAQYSRKKPGFTNIEFEAKLFKDIYTSLYSLNAYSVSIGFPAWIEKEYFDWVSAVSENGFTLSLLAKYNTMLGYFNPYNSYYGGYLLPGLNTPLAIIRSKAGCN